MENKTNKEMVTFKRKKGEELVKVKVKPAKSDLLMLVQQLKRTLR